MTPRTVQSLHDASSACQEIQNFIDGITFFRYEDTRSIQLIIERLMLILGEALHRVRRSEPAVARRIPRANNVIAMRHVIVHGYDAIENTFVWEAATYHVPHLKAHIDSALRA